MPELGNRVWDWAERLRQHSDPGYAERGELTVTYLTDAHRAVAQQLSHVDARRCGFDEVAIDAVGNVVGVYHGADRERAAAAHRQPLRHGAQRRQIRRPPRHPGADGLRARALARQGRRLPFGLEVVGFAEEEGQRYKAVFLGSGALTGAVRPALARPGGRRRRHDARGDGSAPACASTSIAALARDPARYLGFVEVHIEQGPVLSELDLPLGIVTSINGSVRYVGEIDRHGEPRRHHADGPCAATRRPRPPSSCCTSRSAAAGAEPRRDRRHARSARRLDQRRARTLPVQPRRPRAPTDDVRDACAADVRAELARDLRAPRRALHARGNDARRRGALCGGVAGALGTRVDALGLPVHPACRAAPATTR